MRSEKKGARKKDFEIYENSIRRGILISSCDFFLFESLIDRISIGKICVNGTIRFNINW